MFFYEDLTLEEYTTTIDDVKKNRRKPKRCEAVMMDEESILNINQKPESTLIFKGNETGSANSF